MPIRYDSVLVAALAAELRRRLAGRRLEELHLDPVVRSVRLVLDDGSRLDWLLHPTAGHLLAGEAGADLRTRRRRARGAIAGPRRVVGVEAPPDERLLRIGLEAPARRSGPSGAGGSPGPESLVLELHTNQWNAALLSGDRIRAVLWRRTAGDRPLREGAVYRAPPPGARLGADGPPGPEAWERWWNETQTGRDGRRAAALRGIAWASATNAGWLVGDAAPGDSAAALTRLARLRNAGAAWLLPRASGPQPYPLDLDEPGAEPFPSLLAAMAESAAREGIAPGPRGAGEAARGTASQAASPSPEEARLASALREILARTRRRRRALERELAAGPAADDLRAVGHLLLARMRDVPPGAESVRLADFEGGEREVELDPAADVAANARRYYDRARRRERAERRLPRRIEAARRRERRVGELLERLRVDGPSDEAREIVDRLAPGPDGSGETAAPARRPWRSLRSSGGLEIRVGRSARDNDDLTFHHSAPEDVWLHARHAHGAHVILRWGRRDQNPPERDIEDAAVAAAVYSEARTSGTVAVDWTRRKHVRKPRKAAPGAVVPDRVRTLFVAPDEGRVRRMMKDGPDAA